MRTSRPFSTASMYSTPPHNIGPHQPTCNSHARPMYAMQITVSATHICVASAVIAYDATTDTSTPSKSVWQLPVSTVTKVLMEGDHSPHNWEEIAPTPHYGSALVQHIHWLMEDMSQASQLQTLPCMTLIATSGPQWGNYWSHVLGVL